MLKHIASKCRFCDPIIRNAVNELQRLQSAREGLPSGRPRYGSRKIFFQRIWARLHGSPEAKEEESNVSGITMKVDVLSSLQDEVAAAVAAEAAKISAETMADETKRKAETDNEYDESSKKVKSGETVVEQVTEI